MTEKTYGTLITTAGAALIADCILQGKKLPITQAAAGDGDGAYYQPTVDQTALKHEVWRGAITRVEQSDISPQMLDVKIVMGDDVGGFTVREMALYDDKGTMIAVCNTPDTEKVIISGGVSNKLTMLMHIVVADTSVLEFSITPALDVLNMEDLQKHNNDETAHPALREDLKAMSTKIAELDKEIEKHMSDLKLFILNITFAGSMKGKAFTVAGAGMDTYNGTVPDSLSVTIAVPEANTTYTVKCNGKTKTVTTGSYYGLYYGHVDKYSTVLAENTPQEIFEVCKAGLASLYWKEFDEIDIPVLGETLTFQIAGLGHDDLTSGGKAPITLGMKHLMAEKKAWNPQGGTNSGGFTDSDIYNWLENTVFPSLPKEWQAVIRPVDKKCLVGKYPQTIETKSMKLFCYSMVETGNFTTYDGYKDEGETYPIFTDDASRIKRMNNGDGSVAMWASRTPMIGGTGHYGTTYKGIGQICALETALGICFAFCIG